MRSPEQKIHTLDSAVQEIQRKQKQGLRVVTTNGCFDLLHRGHVAYLNQARSLGDLLFIGVNSDQSVKKIKGPQRPVQSESDRAFILAGLECVDGVFIFQDDTPQGWIAKAQPRIHAKGADYSHKDLPERKVVESYGGELKLIPFLEGHSTSQIIKKSRDS